MNKIGIIGHVGTGLALSAQRLIEQEINKDPDLVIIDLNNKESIREQLAVINNSVEYIPYKRVPILEMNSMLPPAKRIGTLVSVRTTPKVDRNAKCSCGSGIKAKKCRHE